VAIELDATATAPPHPAAGESTASTAPIEAGARLGHFRVERKLGAGGMGEVYLGHDLALDRPVALKLLPVRTTDDPVGRDRLVREARAQARIVHPNVGHIYFIGEERGRLYFAMEYVPGETLAERIARGPMPVEDALAAIRGAALGLREAHRSGFTHRDVKPSNLMLDAHGEVKVLDFGLVSTAAAGDADRPVEQTSLAGTPLYMAPEQARGEPIDLRADIYALGATLYHLVSGKPPFAATTAQALESMHATAPRPAVPRGHTPRAQLSVVDALCARMMAPRPADRFASYDELLRAIEMASQARSRPAGFVVRVAAVGIDAIIAMIVLLAALAALRVSKDGNFDVDAPPIAAVVMAIYTLGLARWGRTPGMALLELEVVAVATSARPSWLRALARSGALFGTMIVGDTIEAIGNATATDLVHDIGSAIDAVGALGPPLMLVFATWLGPNKRAPWDRLAGTMVRYRK
jgi:serine/threonine-protein kinase